jgi:hypothetical protein
LNKQNENAANARTTVQIMALALLLLLLCYLPFLNGTKDFVVGDCEVVSQPLHYFVRDCLGKGIFPLWNPHSYCGYSQVAATSLFYPLTYLTVFLPFSAGKALYMLLHQFLGGLAAFFLVDRLAKSKEAAIFASLSVMFCGYLFAMAKHTDFVASVCALLFCFWMTDCFFRDGAQKQVKHFALLCLCAAMLFLTGRPEIFLPGSFLLLLQAVAEIWCLKKQGLPVGRLAEIFAGWSAAFVCGALVSCPMVLPSLEWTKLSPRAQGLQSIAVFKWSACWYDWLSLVFWQPLGDLELLRVRSGAIQNLIQYAGAAVIPLFPAAFMGPAFFTSCCLGFLDRTFRGRFLFLAFCLAAALICAGDQTPIAPFLFKTFPNLAIIRYPIKGLIFVLLPAVFVAAVGFAWVLDKSKVTAGKLYFFLALWSAVLLLGPCLYYSGSFAAALSFLVGFCKTNLQTCEFAAAQNDLLVSFLVTGGWGVAFTLVACLYRSAKVSRAVAFSGLLTLAVAPMISYGIALNREAADGGYYDKPPALDVLLQKWTAGQGELKDGQFRIVHLLTGRLVIPAAYEEKAGLPYFLSVISFGRDVLLADMHFQTRWNYANGYTLAETAQILHLFDEAFYKSNLHVNELPDAGGRGSDYPLARFCGLTSSKVVITEDRDMQGKVPYLDAELFSLAHVEDFLNLRIYKTKNNSSRFYFAGKVEAVGFWPTFTESVCASANKSVIDDGTTYLHSSDLKLIESAMQSAASPPVPKLTTALELICDEPSKVEFAYRKNTPGLLVLRDQFYPGWKVFVDQVEQPVLRANLINRAVIVPAGVHRVMFQYCPDSLARGFALAGLGLLLSLILAAVLAARISFRQGKANASEAA